MLEEMFDDTEGVNRSRNSRNMIYFFGKNKLEAPRSLYSSPGYNNNISQ